MLKPGFNCALPKVIIEIQKIAFCRRDIENTALFSILQVSKNLQLAIKRILQSKPDPWYRISDAFRGEIILSSVISHGKCNLRTTLEVVFS